MKTTNNIPKVVRLIDILVMVGLMIAAFMFPDTRGLFRLALATVLFPTMFVYLIAYIREIKKPKSYIDMRRYLSLLWAPVFAAYFVYLRVIPEDWDTRVPTEILGSAAVILMLVQLPYFIKEITASDRR